MRRSARDLGDPCNLIHAARKALGLLVIESRWVGHDGAVRTTYSSEDRYPPELERYARLPDGRSVRLLRSSPLRPDRSGYRGSGYRRGRSSKHRLQIRCAGCRQWIPIGRYTQHVGKRTCEVARVGYEERTAPRTRSLMELRRLAFKAKRSPETREVLHDALLEVFPRRYPRMLRAAARSLKREENENYYERFVIFRPRFLRERQTTDDKLFFRVVDRAQLSNTRVVEPTDIITFRLAKSMSGRLTV